MISRLRLGHTGLNSTLAITKKLENGWYFFYVTDDQQSSSNQPVIMSWTSLKREIL